MRAILTECDSHIEQIQERLHDTDACDTLIEDICDAIREPYMELMEIYDALERMRRIYRECLPPYITEVDA